MGGFKFSSSYVKEKNNYEVFAYIFGKQLLILKIVPKTGKLAESRNKLTEGFS
jgi:hypothetical protein